MGLVTFALWGKQASRAQIRNCASNIDNETEAVEELGTSLWKELHPKEQLGYAKSCSIHKTFLQA